MRERPLPVVALILVLLSLLGTPYTLPIAVLLLAIHLLLH